MYELSVEQEQLALEQNQLAERQHGLALKLSALFGYYAAENDVPKTPVTMTIPDTRNKNLIFTTKELSDMPKSFRKEFRTDGCTAHIRRRADGPHRCSYEIRYRRNGYSISVSAKTLEEAKAKFIDKLKSAEKTDDKPKIPTEFNAFALFWLENFHKRKVAEQTYKKDLQRFNRTLAQRFEKLQIKQVNATHLQQILDEYQAKGQGKTADEVHCLLNQIFKYAVKFGLIAYNPVDMVCHTKHKYTHGKALTKDEERKLLSASAGTHYQLMFAVALYAGLRPNEYATVQIHGNMIVAVNSKRKNGKTEYKRIPINPMLKPFLQGIDAVKWVGVPHIRNKFNSILPNHILYDLRTTFYTRCVECGLQQAAIDEMVGHSGGILKDTYTDLSDEYLLNESKKLQW